MKARGGTTATDRLAACARGRMRGEGTENEDEEGRRKMEKRMKEEKKNEKK